MTETVKTSAFEMDYFRFGHGERTLVIIPGLSVQSVMPSEEAIARAYAAMTDDFTAFVFDRRKDPPDGYTVFDMARDACDAIEKVCSGKVSAFGASQGGMILMAAAAARPELFEAIVLGSTAARAAAKGTATVERWIDLAKNGDAEGLYLDFGASAYPKNVFEAIRADLSAAAKSVTADELERFAVYAGAIRGFDMTDRLNEISCPVFAVGDRNDEVLGGEATEEIAAAFAGRGDCESFMYEGFGHAAYDVAPDYKDRMLDFLKRHAGTSPKRSE